MSMDMQNYGFFDYQEGDDDTYRYDSEEFSTVMAATTGDGVNYKYGDKFAVTGTSGMNLTIGTGGAWVSGHYCYNEAAITYTVEASTTKDALCIHLDRDNRKMEITQIAGTSSAYPEIPEDYLLLYYVRSADSVVTLNDARSYNYGSSNAPSCRIIYSTTEPTGDNASEGTVWLKPVS